MAIASELATKISFIGSLKPLHKLNTGLDTAVKTIGVATVAFTTAGYAVNAFIENTLASADAQGQLARETGLSVEAIQEWGYVASVNGSTAQAFETSVANLSKKIGEASTKGSEDFNRLGISVRDSFGNVKNAETILLELRSRFKELGLSVQQQGDFLEKLGIDRTMIQTLNLSSDALDKLRGKARSLGILSQDEIDRVIEYNDSLTTTRYGIDALQKKIAVAFTPQLKDLNEGFVDLLVANKDLIKNGLENFFTLLGAGFKAVYNFGGAIKDLFSNMTDGQLMLAKITLGIYAFNKAFNMSPIGRAVTLITGLVAIVDDLRVGLAGGESAISKFFEKFDIDLLGRVKLVLGELRVGVEQIAWTVNNLLLGLATVGNFLGADFDTKSLKQDITENNRVIDSQRRKNQLLYGGIQSRERQMSSQTNINQTNNNTINIKANDTEGIKTELQRELQNANTQFRVGGN